MSSPTAPSAPPPATGRRCPRCGAPAQPLQEYCLECGLHLPQSRGAFAAVSSRWSRRLPWYPGDWIWPALLVLVIAVVATLAAVALGGESERRVLFTATTEGGVVLTTATPTPTAPEPPTVTAVIPTDSVRGVTLVPPGAPSTAAVTPGASTPAKPTGPIAWPAGKDGYTVVLESVPTGSGRTQAVARAQRAIRDGLSPVGILQSSRYSSLLPGYYVIFAGIYDTQDEAVGALDSAKSDSPTAYVKRVTR